MMLYTAYTRIATVLTLLQADTLLTQLKKNITMNNITQDEFDAYEDVRQSGITNMFDVSVVSDYSGLSKEKIINIMSNYEILSIKYGN